MVRLNSHHVGRLCHLQSVLLFVQMLLIMTLEIQRGAPTRGRALA